MLSSTTTHLAAAERALREFARVSHGKAQERAERSAGVLARMASDSGGGPLGEGATARSELADALLDGADALWWKADQERQAAFGQRWDAAKQRKGEARASEYERHADAILEASPSPSP